MLNFFQLFNIVPSYNVNIQQINDTFLQLQKKHHPDTSANNLSLSADGVVMSSIVNQAYETLSCNLKRAMYVIKIWYVVDIATQQSTIVNNNMMEQILNLQMELAQIAGNAAMLATFSSKITTQIKLIEQELQNLLEKQNILTKDICITKVIELKFYHSILNKIY